MCFKNVSPFFQRIGQFRLTNLKSRLAVEPACHELINYPRMHSQESRIFNTISR